MIQFGASIIVDIIVVIICFIAVLCIHHGYQSKHGQNMQMKEAQKYCIANNENQ